MPRGDSMVIVGPGAGDGLAGERLVKADRAIKPANDRSLIILCESKRRRPIALLGICHFLLEFLRIENANGLSSAPDNIHLPSVDQAMRRIVPSWANFAVSILLLPSMAEGLTFQTRMRLSTPAAATRAPSGTPDDGVQILLRFRPRVEAIAGGDVPEFHRAIGADAGQHFAIRTKRDAEHRPVVADQLMLALAALRCPRSLWFDRNFRLPVSCRRRKPPASKWRRDVRRLCRSA